MEYDKIIIGAGLYGLYSALFCGKKGEKILVLEYDGEAFSRATFINQARVHSGYHYPRSYSTAIKSARYFERFYEDYKFSILDSFEQIYATSKNFSWTNALQFKKFCKATKIKCDSISPSQYFKENMCDGCFVTEEYSFDAHVLKDFFLKEILKYPNIVIQYNARITSIKNEKGSYYIDTNGNLVNTKFILNSTYASVNQILNLLNFEPFQIKYELCEIILCKVSDALKNVGLTVMDGPFFSLMPFGKTGYHSLSAVSYTPHTTSYDLLPTFECQKSSNSTCSKEQLGNCNTCPAKPVSAWNYMSTFARKYMKDEYEFEYVDSLYSIKPILKASEIDDSRPTVIKYFSHNPTFVSVLSGKINTVYDLEGVLTDGNQ